MVSALAGTLPAATPTSTDGSFELRALVAGATLLAAETDGGASDPRPVTLVEGEGVGPVELRLKRLRTVNGTVQAAGQPVPGAEVWLMAVPPAVGGGRATSDLEGRFTAELPSSFELAVVAAAAPGLSLRAQGPVQLSRPLALELSPVAGAIEISLPESSEALMRRGLTLGLSQDGLPIPAPLWMGQARKVGALGAPGRQTLALSGLAPGEYQLCVLAVDRLSSWPWRAGESGEMACDSGVLPAGGSLMLRP